MNSKLSRPQSQTTNVAIKNQLQRSAIMDPFQGTRCYVQAENRTQGPPLSSAYLQQAGRMNGRTHSSSPPPLPPRQNNTAATRYGYSGYPGMSRYSGMNSYYSPLGPSRYSSGLYSSGMYSPYSTYRMPYGHFGAPSDEYNSFLQMAEQSTRPAFESIESVVHIVNSISMMLESTYGAIHGSYSAILGVVDQFARLRDHFAQVFSVLAMLKGLHWLCLKVLYILGLRKSNPSVENAWHKAYKASMDGDYPSNQKGSVWPFFMFISLVIGAPWLMFKLLSRSVGKKTFDPKLWVNEYGKVSILYGLHDFAATQPGELSFKAGEKLIVSPEDAIELRSKVKNWILVCNGSGESGLVPLNYLTSSSNSMPPRQQIPNSQMQAPLQEIPPYFNEGLTNGGLNGTMQSGGNVSKHKADNMENDIINSHCSNIDDSSSTSAHSNVIQSQPSSLASTSSVDNADSTNWFTPPSLKENPILNKQSSENNHCNEKDQHVVKSD